MQNWGFSFCFTEVTELTKTRLPALAELLNNYVTIIVKTHVIQLPFIFFNLANLIIVKNI